MYMDKARQPNIAIPEDRHEWPLWPFILLFQAPAIANFWGAHLMTQYRAEGAGIIGMVMFLGIPLTVLAGLIALYITFRQWRRYFRRVREEGPVSATPYIAVSLLNFPFFYCCIYLATML